MTWSFKDKKIGIAITGSYCTLNRTFEEIQKLAETNADLYTVFSFNTSITDTRFGTHDFFIDKAIEITGKKPIMTISDAEPIGPKKLFDILVITPCTGNTLAKLANGITDTPVLMAAKAHLRNNRPVVISLASNDALGINLKNIGILLNSKNIYFVPFGQDNYNEKPNSLVAHIEFLNYTIASALEGKQIQPVIKSPF
jgi:dipicolinate synthase subunit B